MVCAISAGKKLSKKKLAASMTNYMKFSKHSILAACSKIVPGTEHKKYCDCCPGGHICLRVVGHEGPCIARMDEAALADGREHCCHVLLGEQHLPDCWRLQPADEPE